MADATTISDSAEFSARMTNAAQAFAMIRYPQISEFAIESIRLVGTSLIFTVGTAKDSIQCNESVLRTFLGRGPAVSREDLEGAIADTHGHIFKTDEGQAGWLKIEIGVPRDDRSVDVTYSFVQTEMEPVQRSEEEEAADAAYINAAVTDEEIAAQVARMNA